MTTESDERHAWISRVNPHPMEIDTSQDSAREAQSYNSPPEGAGDECTQPSVPLWIYLCIDPGKELFYFNPLRMSGIKGLYFHTVCGHKLYY